MVALPSFPEISIPDEIPGGIPIPEMPEGAKGVVDCVMGGHAFKNPLGEGIGALTGVMGDITGQIDEMIGSASGELLGQLETLKSSIGEGLSDQLNALKSHTDIMSGAGGDLAAFGEKVGIGGAIDSAKRAMGQGAGGFGDMFGSLQSGDMLNSLSSKMGDVQNALAGGIGGLLEGGVDLNSLSSGISGLGSDLMGQVNLDNAAFDGAKNLIQGMGISSMLTAGNPFVDYLTSNAIGTPACNKQIEKAGEEKKGKKLSEEEKVAVEQAQQAAIETVKAKGIKSEKIAKTIGDNTVTKPEEIAKVKGRPTYRNVPTWPRRKDLFPGIGDKPAIVFGKPIWIDKDPAAATAKVGRMTATEAKWILWWGWTTSEHPFEKYGGRKSPTTAGGGIWGDYYVDKMKPGDTVFIQLFRYDSIMRRWVPHKFTKDTPRAYDIFFGGGSKNNYLRIYDKEIFGVVDETGKVINPDGDAVYSVEMERPEFGESIFEPPTFSTFKG